MDYGAEAGPQAHSGWTVFLQSIGSVRLVLLTTKAEATIWDFSFRPDDIILMGRESAGLPEEVHALADARLVIPMAEGTRSLNIAIAAGMAVGEATRQLG